MKKLPITCPACNSPLQIKNLICQECETGIQGQFELPTLASLPLEDQAFILDFLKASGSLKEMAKLLRLSYPTVRNRLDEIIERIKVAESPKVDGQEKKG